MTLPRSILEMPDGASVVVIHGQVHRAFDVFLARGQADEEIGELYRRYTYLISALVDDPNDVLRIQVLHTGKVVIEACEARLKGTSMAIDMKGRN